MMSSDLELKEACLAGNRQAFGRIVERYQSLICAIAYSATGDLGVSEDLAQETFVTAWKRLGELRDRTKLRAWLCGIARNLTNNWIRQRSRWSESRIPAGNRSYCTTGSNSRSSKLPTRSKSPRMP